MIGRREKPLAADDPKIRGFDDFELMLGDVMRGERATLGKSLLDVQRELKIKAAYIAAIENSDPSAFETAGFVAGYVRSYARYLGLDPEWAYSRFCQESQFATGDALSRSAAKQKSERPRRREGQDPLSDPKALFLPQAEGLLSRIEPGAIGSVLVLVMLISALGYGGWTVFREVQQVQFVPVENTPGVTTNVDVLAGSGTGDEVAALGDDLSPSAEALDRLYRPQALDVPIFEARDAPISTLNPAEMGTFARVERPVIPELADPAFLADPEALADAEFLESSDAPAIQVVAETPPEVVLFAVRPSWVRVRAADGTVLFEKILDAGEEYVLPATEEPPQLRAGNAGSVYFTVNGQTYGPAGVGPAVVKNVPLGAADLVAAYQPADPTSDADLARFIAVAEARDQ